MVYSGRTKTRLYKPEEEVEFTTKETIPVLAWRSHGFDGEYNPAENDVQGLKE